MRSPLVPLVIPALFTLLLSGCAASGAGTPPRPTPPWSGGIRVDGALRAIMRQGRTDSRVKLNALLPDPELCGIGALAGLAGEITILDGTAYLSYPEGEDSARTTALTQSDAGAALLVTARVPSWRTMPLSESIPWDELATRIAGLASAAGLDPEQRIPFQIQGEFQDLEWHVIDGGRLPPGPSTHEAHQKASVLLHADRARGTLVGFYSTHDQGVFTHMDSAIHVHCVLRNPFSAGHVNHAIIPAGSIIRFPVPPPPAPRE